MDDKEPPAQDQAEAPKDAEQQDLEAAGHSTADYANYEPPKKERNPTWRKVLIVLTAVVILAGLATGAYFFIKNRDSGKAEKEPTASTQTEETAPPATSQISTTTKNYSSANFNLSFDYPDDWKVTDSGGVLTVKSPATSLKDAGGQQTNGQIVMTIRAKDQKLTEFDEGAAMASRQSVKIDYTKPTQSQRGSTYESFLAYFGSDSGTVLDGVYITGDSGYTKGQSIPKDDVLKVEPVISITFFACTSGQCTEKTTPIGIAASSWDDKSFSGPLEAMLKSLSIN
jgi:hypothetical protein